MQANERGRLRAVEEIPCCSFSPGAFAIFHRFFVYLPSCLQVEAESQQDIAESFDIDAVPSFVILRVR